MTKPEIVIFPNKEELAQAAAKEFVTKAQQAIEDKGRFSVVLAGGGTPKDLHKLLASPEIKAQIEWSKVSLFFGDERFVPQNDEQSNYFQAYEVLLKHLEDTDVTIYAMPTENVTAEEGARAYQNTLQTYFSAEDGSKDGSKDKAFDLVFLGIGPDGHTASLFPQHPLVTETSDALVQVIHDSPKPPATRLTLSFKSLNAAKDIIVLATGHNKQAALKAVFDESISSSEIPVKGIKPINGTLRWFVDEALVGDSSF